VNRRMVRPPVRTAAWNERETLYLALVERADREAFVTRARDRATRALDTLIDDMSGQPAKNLIALLRSLRALVRAYVAAEPALSEFAYPAGRINRDEVGSLPPQFTYFVAPLASIGIVGQTAFRRLLEGRIARDENWLAKIVLQELARQATFTAAVLHSPQRSLAELRAIAGTRRRRGRPAGRSRSTEWHDLPETSEALIALIRPVVVTMRRNGDRVNITTVAARLGFEDRRLREVFAERGIVGPKLLKQIGREIEEQRR
jgi:hypothetical protein